MSGSAVISDTAAAPSARRRRGALARRLITVPRTFLLLAVVTPLLPLLVALALVVDLVRWALRGTPWTLGRLVATLWCYVVVESIGLLALLAVWLVSRFAGPARHRRLIDGTYTVQRVYLATLFAAIMRIFRMRLEVEGDGCVTPGPILVFVRHTSIADTLLPSTVVTRRHGIRLRFVLKRELLQDPCIDIAGNRIPNHFVDRGARDVADIEALRDLTRDLASNEGVLIYPEGTRFTEKKRRAILERLASGDPRVHALAQRLRHVLPPRIGGPLALLDGHTPADVVFLAHQGFDGAATIGDVLRGGLVGRTIRARLWRVPRSAIPASPDERVAWLYEQWAAVDAWVGDAVTRTPGSCT